MNDQLTNLVEKAIRHDEAAFWKIYELKWYDVFYTALKMLNDQEAAADAVQETFLQVYKKIDTVKHPVAFNAWLYRIAMNTCHKMLAKRITERRHEVGDMNVERVGSHDATHSPSDSLENKFDREELMNAMRTLPENQRATLVLYYYNQMSYAEIATAMGITKVGVETRLRRARQALKKYLTQREEGAVAKAMVAAPALAGALMSDSRLLFDPRTGDMIREGLQHAMALVVAGGSAAIGAVATGASFTGGGTGAVTTASAGIGAKVVAGVAAATLVAGAGAGAVYSASKADDPLVSEAAASPRQSTRSSAYSSAQGIVAAIPAQPADPEPEPAAPPEEVQAPSVTPSKAAETPAPKPKPAPEPEISTLADMIGAANAQKLKALARSAKKGEAQAFFDSVGLAYEAQQQLDGATYRCYVLEKQKKRLYVIDRETGEPGYGLSYVFEDTENPLPESWELFLEYR